METAKKELDKFIKSGARNEWLYGDVMHIYVRNSYRFISNESNHSFEECLDLANIQVDDEHQGKGVFTSFLEAVVRDYRHLNLFVESIQNPAMEHICKKFGFVYVNCDDEGIVKNMILRKENYGKD